MAEFKPKAWDESNKIMHYDVQFIKSGLEDDDWIIFKSNLNIKDYLNNPHIQKQIKIMEHTRLKDFEGKDIYQGDIIRSNRIGSVIGDKLSNFIVDYKDDDSGFWLYNEQGIVPNINLNSKFIKEYQVRVVGNKWEGIKIESSKE